MIYGKETLLGWLVLLRIDPGFCFRICESLGVKRGCQELRARKPHADVVDLVLLSNDIAPQTTVKIQYVKQIMVVVCKSIYFQLRYVHSVQVLAPRIYLLILCRFPSFFSSPFSSQVQSRDVFL